MRISDWSSDVCSSDLQERAGVVIAIPEGRRIRPKALLLNWMATAGHQAGPLFRKLTPADRSTERPMSDRSVARLVKKYAAAAGYDAAEFAGQDRKSTRLNSGH